MSENISVQQAPKATVAEPVKNKFANPKKKRKLPKWVKIVTFIVIIGAVAFGVYYATASLTKKETIVTTDFASRNRLQSQITGYGNIEPTKKGEYGAKTRGTVIEVFVKGGDIVKIGDLLFTIDPTEFRTELEDANKKLNISSKALRDALSAIENTTFKAPFAGKLVKIGTLKEGQAAAAGAVIGTLVDDSTMKLSLYFSYAYENVIKPGMTVNVSVPDSMTQTTGTVDSIDKIRKPIDGAVCFRVNVSVKNPGTLTEEQSASGYIVSGGNEIMPSETGKLAYNNKEELVLKAGGDLVYANLLEYGEYKAGQTMCTVDGAALQDAVSQAQASYDAAAKVVADLQETMTSTEIRADIDGMVSAIMVNVGDKLTASGTPVLTVSDTSSLVVNVNIDEMDVSKVKIGMTADITYNDGADMVQGTITYVGFEAKTAQGDGWNSGAVAYFPAKISIGNSEKLLPGMGVNYTITSLIKEDCLTVPSSAIVYTEDGSTVVYVRDNGGKPQEPVAPEDMKPMENGTTDMQSSGSVSMGISSLPMDGAMPESGVATPESGEGMDVATPETEPEVPKAPKAYEKFPMPEGVVPKGFYAVKVEIGLSDDRNTEIISGIDVGTEVYTIGTVDGGSNRGMMGGGSIMIG